MRAREYLRVSKDRSGRARSVDEQHADLERDAEQHGWTLTAPYAEPDVSASVYGRRTRGEFAAMLADIRGGRFGADVLMLWEPSRGSRQVGEWVDLIDACRAASVKIWVHTHSTLYDPDNARHRRTLLEDAVDAEYESDKTRDRILRALSASANAGRPHGKLLFGYVREYDDRGRFVRQIPHPEQAAIVREIFRRVDAGDTLRQIARDLNARGVPTPGGGAQWVGAMVGRVATRASYAGWRTHRGVVTHRGAWPALVPEELWQRVHTRLSDPSRRTAPSTTARHIMSGVARCGVCDSVLQSRHLKGHKGVGYACPTNHCVLIRADWLDQFVTELVLSRMEQTDILSALAPDDTEALEARDELAALEARLQEFYTSAAAGHLSPQALAAIEAQLLPQIEQARQRAQPASVPAPIRRLAGARVREVWAELPVPLRKETIRLLMTVHVDRTRSGSRTFDPERVRVEWLS